MVVVININDLKIYTNGINLNAIDVKATFENLRKGSYNYCW
jgi:hypothetical protein